LEAFLTLPYEIFIPNTLFEDELLKFTASQLRTLLAGVKVADLPGERVLRARQVVLDKPRLSVHDGFAFALAESHSGCILLTGDGALRALAEKSNMEVHGILWIVDQLHDHRISTASALYAALRLLAEDRAVRLPRKELAASLKRYGRSEQPDA